MRSRQNPEIILVDGTTMRPPKIKKWAIVLGILFVLFLVAHNATPLYTDWLWFQEVGYKNVFTTTIAARTTLFLASSLLFFAFFYANLRIARRLAPDETNRFLMERFGPEWGKRLQKGLGWFFLAISLFISLWVGRIASENWANWLEFSHSTPFGIKDPVFHNDVGFYVFQLPFLKTVWLFAMGTLILTGVVVIGLNFADRALEKLTGLPDVAKGVRTQLLLIIAAIAVTAFIGTRLSAFDLLLSDNSHFYGAGYTDLHYRMLALNAQAFFLAIIALTSLLTIWRPKSFRYPIIAAAGWLASLLLLGYLLPGIVQKTYVEPNELTTEQEFIKQNIEFTKIGFGLQNVKQVEGFPADASLTSAGINSNRDTLENVRLWDYQYLGKIYSQLQTVKSYYKFEKDTAAGSRSYNIDIDRYLIGGHLRQVMLGPREMDSSGLASAISWQNQKLGYTHGYGVVMSPVNKVVQGLPGYFLNGIPQTTSPEAADIKVKQPAIYYGQLDHEYVFVDTAQQEFDYPSAGVDSSGNSQDHYSSYQGSGGIPIGRSELTKLAFSLQLGDPNILLTHSFKESTRILYRRDIRERIQMVAPFLQQDGDPYMVVDPDTGKLIWIVDCYTISDHFPYSTPQSMEVNSTSYIAPNYIRNSVKAMVDAYDGTISLYISDKTDPIAQTYSRIFPGLLKPLEQMPAGLRAHLRYPEDLFRLQRTTYSAYHVNDPRVFYSKEDTWASPSEPTDDPATAQTGPQQKAMEPYYVIMKLPGLGETVKTGGHTAGEEFLLMSPLAPVKRESQNILGWMCARCDGDNYGQLVLYRFPQQASVNGPSQALAFANNDTIISKELSLLRQGGSSAKFGNLIVIPVEKSLLYIAPLYVESTGNAAGLPKLQKVIIAFGERVVMADTFENALASLFTDGAGVQNVAGGTPPPTAGNPLDKSFTVPAALRNLIDKAAAQYDMAQMKMKAGDWAGYGAAMKELDQTIVQLRRGAGKP